MIYYSIKPQRPTMTIGLIKLAYVYTSLSKITLSRYINKLLGIE